MKIAIVTLLSISIHINHTFALKTEKTKKSSPPTCGLSTSDGLKPWFGWMSECDESLAPEPCVQQGPHCGYCFDKSGSDSELHVGCGYTEKLKITCPTNFYNEPKYSPCSSAATPGKCVSSGVLCSWCTDRNYTKTRCNTESRHVKNGCFKVETIKNENIRDDFKHSQKFSATGSGIKNAVVNVRAGQSSTLPITIQEPKNYPVDLYLALDLSYSMKETLAQVKKVTTDIFDSFSKNDEVQVGFSQFVDKLRSPMSRVESYKIDKPWTVLRKSGSFNAEPTTVFQNIASLSKNKSEVLEKLMPVSVSANRDVEEAQLQAMIESVVCETTGWRKNSLRILLIITESWFHHAGDGVGKLAGLVDRNDGKCHSVDGKLVDDEQDYSAWRNRMDFSVDFHFFQTSMFF